MLNTKLTVPSVGFSVTGLDHTKFSFYQFESFLFVDVIVIFILLKTTFSQISIHSQLLVEFYGDRTTKKTLLRRLKNIDMASEKLYRNTLTH